MKRLPTVIASVVVLVLAGACTDDQPSAASVPDASTPTSSPPVTAVAGPAAEVRSDGLYDCGPFFTKLGREMTYYVRLFDDGTMAEMMSRNDAPTVYTALAERVSDDLSTDIGVGPFTVAGDAFSATTTDTLGYQITYTGSVDSPEQLSLRTVSGLYGFDERRTCNFVTTTDTGPEG